MNVNYKEPLFRGQTEHFIASLTEPLRRQIGFALWLAQTGKKAPSAKPLVGQQEFRGGKVLEIVSDLDTNTYRTVYTIEFEEAVYVLDAFEKKSKRGIATPQRDIDRIVERIKTLRRERDTPEARAQIAEMIARRALRQRQIEQRKGQAT